MALFIVILSLASVAPYRGHASYNKASLFETLSPQHASSETPSVPAAMANIALGVEDDYRGPDPASFSIPGSVRDGVSQVQLGQLSEDSSITYTVQKRDTLSTIAARFGLSVSSLTQTNPDMRKRRLSIGQKVRIVLPSTTPYTVADHETIDSIAAKFNIQASSLRRVNQLTSGAKLHPGDSILLPGVTMTAVTTPEYSLLPDMKRYFTSPAEGVVDGQLHDYNAVDIVNSCGTPVTAAAEGIVVPDKDFTQNEGQWNGGYGTFVLLEHPNGTKTRYAHLTDTSVSVGDVVRQGTRIGSIGKTGDAKNCRLQFEVYGARNPLAK